MICPKCKMELNNLNFDVTATCGSQLYDSDEYADYDIDCLTDCVEFDNFSCPECNEILAQTEEEAIKLLKEKNEK